MKYLLRAACCAVMALGCSSAPETTRDSYPTLFTTEQRVHAISVENGECTTASSITSGAYAEVVVFTPSRKLLRYRRENVGKESIAGECPDGELYLDPPAIRQ